ncbi:MAG: PQQ-dependent sugar dehydrogenase [Planctomycetota bacterium]|nr:MAG: PQQ-dependent sugar dehydrogenase [Planctomycetota bacterium]
MGQLHRLDNSKPCRLLPVCILGLLCYYSGLGTLSGAERVLEAVKSEAATFDVLRVVDGLHHPWGFEFLPDGGLLITERRGRLLHWHGGERREVSGLPEIANVGQGGLMDILLDPDFTENQTLFFAYAARYDGGVGTRVARARLDEGFELQDVTVIFSMNPPGRGGRHFGCRLAWHPDGSLFVSIGDRGDQNRAQQLDSHHGSLLRIDRDGRPHPENPFLNRDGAQPEIFSYGHRNAQGLWIDPNSGTIWQNEHGPQGGDTLNAVEMGGNYGWPLATYGEEYGGGRIGVQPNQRQDIINPLLHWTPSIAPSGLSGFVGDAVPGWQGNLFNGALRGMHLRRVVVEDGQVVHQEELLLHAIGRIRQVRQGPDGLLWLCTDERSGGIYKLVPR